MDDMIPCRLESKSESEIEIIKKTNTELENLDVLIKNVASKSSEEGGTIQNGIECKFPLYDPSLNIPDDKYQRFKEHVIAKLNKKDEIKKRTESKRKQKEIKKQNVNQNDSTYPKKNNRNNDYESNNLKEPLSLSSKRLLSKLLDKWGHKKHLQNAIINRFYQNQVKVCNYTKSLGTSHDKTTQYTQSPNKNQEKIKINPEMIDFSSNAKYDNFTKHLYGASCFCPNHKLIPPQACTFKRSISKYRGSFKNSTDNECEKNCNIKSKSSGENISRLKSSSHHDVQSEEEKNHAVLLSLIQEYVEYYQTLEKEVLSNNVREKTPEDEKCQKILFGNQNNQQKSFNDRNNRLANKKFSEEIEHLLINRKINKDDRTKYNQQRYEDPSSNIRNQEDENKGKLLRRKSKSEQHISPGDDNTNISSLLSMKLSTGRGSGSDILKATYKLFEKGNTSFDVGKILTPSFFDTGCSKDACNAKKLPCDESSSDEEDNNVIDNIRTQCCTSFVDDEKSTCRKNTKDDQPCFQKSSTSCSKSTVIKEVSYETPEDSCCMSSDKCVKQPKCNPCDMPKKMPNVCDGYQHMLTFFTFVILGTISTICLKQVYSLCNPSLFLPITFLCFSIYSLFNALEAYNSVRLNMKIFTPHSSAYFLFMSVAIPFLAADVWMRYFSSCYMELGYIFPTLSIVPLWYSPDLCAVEHAFVVINGISLAAITLFSTVTQSLFGTAAVLVFVTSYAVAGSLGSPKDAQLQSFINFCHCLFLLFIAMSFLY